MDVHHRWLRMAGSPVLRPVSTTATHSTEEAQRNKGHNICGAPKERIGGCSLGFTEQIVLSYFYHSLMVYSTKALKKSHESPFSMVIFTTRQTVPIVQARPPLLVIT